jgi:hypothetical protein
MDFTSPSIVLGYHGTDLETGLQILLGKKSMSPSENSWDWLGSGLYFWENDSERAFEYAENVSKNTQFATAKIKTPFVLGAIIDLKFCLNLTNIGSTPVLKEVYQDLSKYYENLDEKPPQNNGGNRKLDNQVFRTIHSSRKIQNLQPFDTIRSPFPEGDPVYPTSELRDRTHIQICICNPKCILGFFLPQPIFEQNPSLVRFLNRISIPIF